MKRPKDENIPLRSTHQFRKLERTGTKVSRLKGCEYDADRNEASAGINHSKPTSHHTASKRFQRLDWTVARENAKNKNEKSSNRRKRLKPNKQNIR